MGIILIELHTSSRSNNIFSRYEEDSHDPSVLQLIMGGAAVDSVHIFQLMMRMIHISISERQEGSHEVCTTLYPLHHQGSEKAWQAQTSDECGYQIKNTPLLDVFINSIVWKRESLCLSGIQPGDFGLDLLWRNCKNIKKLQLKCWESLLGSRDVGSCYANDVNKINGINKHDLLDDDEEGDICLICWNPGDGDNPLRYPYACSGSIEFVHQDCLLQWLNHSNEYCSSALPNSASSSGESSLGSRDVGSCYANDVNKINGINKRDLLDDDEEGDICLICWNPGDGDNPLRYPYACSGSIEFVHQDCLLQ
ncbi:unnamed protein product [Fraxinus pennsylvanica]|uniref:RING-type E3 ubiquitin transferase n=1 Tax=Fraxinus pennsylvanica TaxID=56036 RepID=A0AAD2AJM4_9LAMI|nr:unnamed protein product [Fraxinus pennsylvanica]